MAFQFFTTICFTIKCLTVFSQDTKLVTNKFPHSPQPAEQYYVLRSNTSIKHGEYVSYSMLDKKHYKSLKNHPDSLEHYIRKRGTYFRGKKHGAWTEYSDPGLLYSSGVYDLDKKIGIWTTSRENGEVLEKFDHDTWKKLTPEIRIPLHYPPKAREKGVQGTVMLEFLVQTNCTVSDITVLQSVNPDCDREATRVVLKFYGYLNRYGPPCEFKRETVKVTFRLQ